MVQGHTKFLIKFRFYNPRTYSPSPLKISHFVSCSLNIHHYFLTFFIKVHVTYKIVEISIVLSKNFKPFPCFLPLGSPCFICSKPLGSPCFKLSQTPGKPLFPYVPLKPLPVKPLFRLNMFIRNTSPVNMSVTTSSPIFNSIIFHS